MLLPLECPLLETWVEIQTSALIGHQTGDPLVCSPALNPWGHTSQGKSVSLKVEVVTALMCSISASQPFSLVVAHGEDTIQTAH